MIRRVDRYELLEEVGSGGMAVVYRGHDTALDREVAVKLLHPHLAARAESRARFSREARAVARLKHPNIVDIYDYAGDAAVESYLVTEFLPGRTLRAFTEEVHLGYPEVGALIVRALADALVHAHAAGVIHRDLKPENVLVLEAGGRRAIKLVDFGIARILTSDERMTMTGALVGSPNHMAPEIIAGREADERSDLFSLGTILYWLATGTLPFAAPNPTATLRRVIEGDFVDPREISPLVSDELAGVVHHALETDPAQRTPTAAAFRDELDVALAGSGLDDPAGELRAFLADPSAYKATLRARIVAATLARADEALIDRETTRGMKLLDRVLALEPENEAVGARLRRITSLARWKRRVQRASGAVAVLLAIIVAVWAIRLLPDSPSALRQAQGESGNAPSGLGQAQGQAGSAPSALGQAQGEAGSAPSSLGQAQGEAESAPSAVRQGQVERGNGLPGPGTPVTRSSPTPHPERPAPRVAASDTRGGARHAAASRTASGVALVSVYVRPYAQRALLDGAEIAHGEQRVVFQLSRGVPHRIEIEHACCFPFVRDFAADEVLPQPFELKVPLRARPARLRVEADPATRVYVDGKLVGNAGESQRAGLEIPVPATGDTPYEANAELRLEQEGRPPIRTMLRLRAGADVTFAAPLSSPPRDVAPPADASAQGASP